MIEAPDADPVAAARDAWARIDPADEAADPEPEAAPTLNVIWTRASRAAPDPVAVAGVSESESAASWAEPVPAASWAATSTLAAALKARPVPVDASGDAAAFELAEIVESCAEPDPVAVVADAKTCDDAPPDAPVPDPLADEAASEIEGPEASPVPVADWASAFVTPAICGDAS